MPKTIKLHGEISRWYGITHDYVASELKGCEGQEVHIHVHSPGGSVFEGWAIFNLLQTIARDTKIKFYVDGIAASMMSFIIQAGHEIWMAENSMIMVHAPRGSVSGTAKQVKEGADLLDKIEQMMKKEYQRRAGIDNKKADQWMEGDNWFTPEEALQAGLIDGIVPPVATRKMENTKNLSPRQAFEAYATLIKPESININTRMKEVTAFLGMGEEAQGPEVVAKIKSMLDNEKQRADTAENDLKTLKVTLAKEKAAALVEGAAQAGKIAPGDVTKFQKLAEADYDTTKALIDTMKPVASVMGQIQPGAEQTKAEKAAEFDRRHKDGTLEELKAKNPERYSELYAARYQ